MRGNLNSRLEKLEATRAPLLACRHMLTVVGRIDEIRELAKRALMLPTSASFTSGRCIPARTARTRQTRCRGRPALRSILMMQFGFELEVALA
jgi:hypothetical protein